MNVPIVQTHSGIWVVRDDLHPGGTKPTWMTAQPRLRRAGALSGPMAQCSVSQTMIAT